MPLYRFFPLDPMNRFTGSEVIQAATDRQAIAIAEQLSVALQAPGFELWDRARPVVQRKVAAHKVAAFA